MADMGAASFDTDGGLNVHLKNPTASEVANQRVNAQAGDIADLATLLTDLLAVITANKVQINGTVVEASAAGIKSDLDEIATDTDNLATLVTNTTGLATDAHAASIVTNTNNIPAKGQSTMSGSTPVTMASDQTPKTSGTATRTNVNGANSDTSLLASNSGRKGALFFNDSTAILYLAYGSGAASTTSYTVQVPASGFFELPAEPVFTGAIRGIWSAANGAVRITELS